MSLSAHKNPLRKNHILAQVALREVDMALTAAEYGEGWGWADAFATPYRRVEFGADTVWLPAKPPQYWGRRHRQMATDIAREIRLSPKAAGRALQALFDAGYRTDEQGCHGPSIRGLLLTAKAAGGHFPAWAAAVLPKYSHHEAQTSDGRAHLGWCDFWSCLGHKYNRETGEYEPQAKVHGVPRRQWAYWRLVSRLHAWRLWRVPFTILKGIDQLRGRSFIIARATLAKMRLENAAAAADVSVNCAQVKPEAYWERVAAYLRGGRDLADLVPHMARGDLWNVFHSRFPQSEAVRGISKELIAELAKGKRMRFFLRLVRTDGKIREHDAEAAARLAVWLEEKAEGFVKKSGLSLHDAGINLPVGHAVTEDKVSFLFRYAHKAATAASVLKNWEAILQHMGWTGASGTPHPLLSKGGMENAESVLDRFSYEGTRHPEFARVAAECHLGQDEFNLIQDRWLDALEGLTHQTVPAPRPLQDGELRLVQLRKDDPRAVFAGVYTGCCQHPGGVGHSCAEHAHASPDGAVWAVEKNGRIIAQAWVWRHKDALVLDSVESTASIGDETRARVKALFQRAAESVVGKLCVEQVYVGTGYGGVHWRELESVSRPFGSPTSYDDSQSVWLLAEATRVETSLTEAA